jgi:8-oxo-dGTP diphosphatase
VDAVAALSPLPPAAAARAALDETVRAAGACLWRPTASGELEVLLVHRPRYDDWSLPKGKVDSGEHILTCAVREVEEETGHRVSLGRPLPVQRYVAAGRPKVVQYWAARADDTAPDWAGTAEIDRVAWVATWQAPAALTHPRDADIVRALPEGPPGTVPLVVLRHAEAIPRKAWSGEDADRPLSPAGELAAGELVPLITAYGVRRIVSSDAVRCTATVAPLASKAGLDTELEHGASEDGHRERPEAAADVVARLVGDAEPVVLCTHRPVVPALQAALGGLAWDGVELPLGTLRTAEMLVAHHARGTVVAVETHGPDTG